jgi:hypothetical protein
MLKKVNSELFFYYLGKSVSQSKLLSSLRLKKFEIRNTLLFEKLGTYLLSLTDQYVGYLLMLFTTCWLKDNVRQVSRWLIQQNHKHHFTNLVEKY